MSDYAHDANCNTNHDGPEPCPPPREANPDGVPDLNRPAPSDSGRRPTGRILPRVPCVSPHRDEAMVAHSPDLVGDLQSVIDDWVGLNTNTWIRDSYDLADRVLTWLAQREWCDCPAFPGIVRERDEARDRANRAEYERIQLADHVEAVQAILSRLRADTLDEADRIEKRGGMVSAAWVAQAMRHLGRYGHRWPRQGEGVHIHDDDAAILNVTRPEGVPTIAVGMTPDPARRRRWWQR